MIPFDLRRDFSRGGHKKKVKEPWNKCFLQPLRCSVVKQSLVQFPCGFTILCCVNFSHVIFGCLKCIGALQDDDDVYILVHPGFRVGGNAQSVKLHPPTHPLQLTSPGILATPGYHNASYNQCFSSGIQATPDYHNACSNFLSGIQATPDYHNAWEVSLSFLRLVYDCLTQPFETTWFRPIPRKDVCRSFFRCVVQ